MGHGGWFGVGGARLQRARSWLLRALPAALPALRGACSHLFGVQATAHVQQVSLYKLPEWDRRAYFAKYGRGRTSSALGSYFCAGSGAAVHP